MISELVLVSPSHPQCVRCASYLTKNPSNIGGRFKCPRCFATYNKMNDKSESVIKEASDVMEGDVLKSLPPIPGSVPHKVELPSEFSSSELDEFKELVFNEVSKHQDCKVLHDGGLTCLDLVLDFLREDNDDSMNGDGGSEE